MPLELPALAVEAEADADPGADGMPPFVQPRAAARATAAASQRFTHGPWQVKLRLND
jgi:hypothetical protein